ncbi:MAG: NAD(P)-dependent oxidoreductase [bacterium]|nr:NAD(P)-dependent oxidoreductase [bacterium]MDW8086712.1 NAD(P)-dependent oxidoreductase [Candidatus Calescibacterium sp.]
MKTGEQKGKSRKKTQKKTEELLKFSEKESEQQEQVKEKTEEKSLKAEEIKEEVKEKVFEEEVKEKAKEKIEQEQREEVKIQVSTVEKKREEKKPLLVITGACGFIGSYAVEIAKEEGWRVRACDLPSAFRGSDEFGRARYPELVKKLADEVAEVDITKPETLGGVFDDADYIFHIAAILKYDVPWELLYNVNVNGTKNVFEEILRSKNSSLKKIVVWSTNGIYGVPKDGEVIMDEKSPVRPVTKYALSKFLEEKTAMIYHKKYGIPVTIIKPTAVYGKRESYMFFNYLKTIRDSKVVLIFSNFDFYFPSIHAADVVRAAIHLSKIKNTDGEDYIVDDDSKNTVIDVMRFLAETFDKPFYILPPVPIPIARIGLISVSYLMKFLSDKFRIKKPLEEEFSLMFGYSMRYSNQKLKSTGFRLKYPRFQDGMRETIKWYQEEGLL